MPAPSTEMRIAADDGIRRQMAEAQGRQHLLFLMRRRFDQPIPVRELRFLSRLAQHDAGFLRPTAAGRRFAARGG